MPRGTVILSGDGHDAREQEARFVAFESQASNLVPLGDQNEAFDVFLLDRATGALSIVGVGALGAQPSLGATQPGLGDAGGWTCFTSQDGALVPEDQGSFWDAFLRGVASGTTERVSAPN